MDDWKVPQWINFNSSDRSNVDENFFDTSRQLETHNEIEEDTNTKTNTEILAAPLDPPKGPTNEKKKPIAAKSRVLTSQVRRYSGTNYRRRSNQYIGLAEAVAKFQYGTPERFRSKPKQEKKMGPLPKRVKQTATKATYAVSPVLLSKLRVRHAAVPSEKTAATMLPRDSKKILKKSSTENLTGKKPLQNALKSLPKTSSSASSSKSVVLPSSEKTAATMLPQVSKKILKKSSTENLTGKKLLPNPLKSLPKTSSSASSIKSVAPTKLKTTKNASNIRVKSVSSTEPKTLKNHQKNHAKLVSSIEMRTQNSNKQIKSNVRTERKQLANLLAIQTKPAVTCTVVTSSAEIQPEASTTSCSEIETAMNRETIPSDNLAIVSSSSEKTPMKLSSGLGLPLLSGDKKKNLTRMSCTPRKKFVTTIVSLDNNEYALEEVEVLHEGIPINTQYRNITRPIPFSFETRNKESSNKKNKLKDENKEIEDEKTKKTTFRARPAPSFGKNNLATATSTKTSSTALKPKDDNVNACPTLSFQQRNELLIQKKKKLFDEIVEKEKKARIFLAKPAPNFKPVFVRCASAENLRSNSINNNPAKNRGLSPAARDKSHSQNSLVSNQENKSPNVAVANQQCPKFKNPLIVKNFKIRKTMEK